MSDTLVERYKFVTGSPVATTNGAIVGDYISVKNAHRVTIIAHLLQAVSHATELGINEATNVAGGAATAVTETFPIWKNADISTTDTLVRGTDAAVVVATAGTNNQMLVIQVDPAKLADGKDCIAATLDDSSQATNYAVIEYIIEIRYPQDNPPSAIID